MVRELSPNALKGMEGQQVIVHDCVYDEFDQICTVRLEKGVIYHPRRKKNQVEVYVTGIILENDEFIFQYNPPLFDKCIYGKFRVYSMPKKGKNNEEENESK